MATKTTATKSATKATKSTAKKAPAKKVAAKKAPAKKAAPAPAKATKSIKPKATGMTYAEMAIHNTGVSAVENPVLAMWSLCEKMQESKRKSVIEAAVAKGISYYTARTQYQLWLTAYRNSK